MRHMLNEKKLDLYKRHDKWIKVDIYKRYMIKEKELDLYKRHKINE